MDILANTHALNYEAYLEKQWDEHTLNTEITYENILASTSNDLTKLNEAINNKYK